MSERIFNFIKETGWLNFKDDGRYCSNCVLKIWLAVPTILDSERKGKRKAKVLAITYAAEISSM